MDTFSRNPSESAAIDPDNIAAMTLNSATPTSILPPELFLDVFSLCETSSRLPATCHACSFEFFMPGEKPHRIWSHRHVYLDPRYNHDTANAFNTLVYGSQEVNGWYTRVAQIESRFAYYLKARAPISESSTEDFPCASGIAPPISDVGPPRPEIASVLSKEFVDWLFSKAGPFSHHATRQPIAVVAQLKRMRASAESDDEGEGDVEQDSDGGSDGSESDADVAGDIDSGPTQFPSRAPAPVQMRRSPNWQLLPDALLLAHYFIRTSQLDLLEHTLAHLRSALPTRATDSAPFAVWSHFMLDNRQHLRFALRAIVINTNNAPISYPTFLCLLSLIDWSKPALCVISRTFADTIDLSTTVNAIASNRDMVQCMLSTLGLLTSPPSSPARVVDILDLFRQCNAPIKYEDVPIISHHITSSYSIFADVFRLQDMPNLPRIAGNEVRYILGSAIASWVVKGNLDLLEIAVEHDLFDSQATAWVLHYAASRGYLSLVDSLASKCSGDNQDLPALVGFAIEHADFSESTAPETLVILFNLLITDSDKSSNLPSPTDVLISRSRHWDSSVLSVALFDAPRHGMLFSWDYSQYLHAQLGWATSHTAYKSLGSSYAIMLGQLIDRCMAEGFDWETLELKCLAVACAIRLIALYKSIDSKAAEEVGIRSYNARRLDPEERAAVARLAEITVSRIREAKVKGEGQDAGQDELSPVTFSSSIPAEHHSALRYSVASFVSASVSLANPVDQADCAIAVFFDTLILLDREFVLDSFPWAKIATLRHWSRFAPAEIASRIDSMSALALVHSAVADSGDTDDVGLLVDLFKALPSQVRDAEEIVHGLGAGMNRRPLFKRKILDGIERAGSKEWWELLARFSGTLDDGAGEDQSAGCELFPFS